jgi:hypothetical protein
MKTYLRLLAFVIGVLASNLCAADVLYSFSGFFSNNNNPGETDFSGTFEIRLPNFIEQDMVVAASSAISCHTAERDCFDIKFYVDAHAHGFTPDSVPVIALSAWNQAHTQLGESGFYYFAPASFSTIGSHSSLYGFNPAVLTVRAVPEPASIFYFLSGALLIVGLRGRRRAR